MCKCLTLVMLKNILSSKYFRVTYSISFILLLAFAITSLGTGYAQKLDDPNIKIESFAEGLANATSMAFLDPHQILVLEQQGAVRLVSNGQLQPQPILELPVNNTHEEQGLLGIAVFDNSRNKSTDTHIKAPDKRTDNRTSVFLYFTQNATRGAGEGDDSHRNRVYKFDWNNETKTLEHPFLIVDLPASASGYHNAGKLMIGPDNLLYGIIGDSTHEGQLQNFKDGPTPDDTGVIFRVNLSDGSAPANGGPLSTNISNALSKYYAYGIRNSFGLTYDPLTGNLWATENGQSSYDEINLVMPGFNSGWKTLSGPMAFSNKTEEDLVMFDGAHYSDPVLSWLRPVGITDIEFLNSSALGKKYANNVFVGDYNNGNLYYFELYPNRTALVLNNIPDLVIDTETEALAHVFGFGFGHVTDLVTGPDGYLYLLSYGDPGKIYRLLPG